MERFNVSRMGRRLRDTLVSPWRPAPDQRPSVLVFVAGLFLGIAVGACFGFGPFRRSTVKAAQRVREVGGDMIDRARHGLDPATHDAPYVALPADPQPAAAGSASGPEQDAESEVRVGGTGRKRTRERRSIDRNRQGSRTTRGSLTPPS
jgi:hypothetical protein